MKHSEECFLHIIDVKKSILTYNGSYLYRSNHYDSLPQCKEQQVFWKMQRKKSFKAKLKYLSRKFCLQEFLISTQTSKYSAAFFTTVLMLDPTLNPAFKSNQTHFKPNV